MPEIRTLPSVEQTIRQFIVDNFLFGEVEKVPSNEESLLGQGIIDSTGVLEMVAFLENQYGIQVQEHELVAANLDSLNNLVAFVSRKRGASS
jgi:acyl carrier protein